jgi:hypothetical protein
VELDVRRAPTPLAGPVPRPPEPGAPCDTFGWGQPKALNLIAGAESPDALEWQRVDGGPLPNDGLFGRHRAIVIATAHEDDAECNLEVTATQQRPLAL